MDVVDSNECRVGQVPTGEDIHRFMDAMVNVTNSRYKSAMTRTRHKLKVKVLDYQTQQHPVQCSTLSCSSWALAVLNGPELPWYVP